MDRSEVRYRYGCPIHGEVGSTPVASWIDPPETPCPKCGTVTETWLGTRLPDPADEARDAWPHAQSA
jgi:hypothetical protein